jgi:hypothetical protein
LVRRPIEHAGPTGGGTVCEDALTDTACPGVWRHVFIVVTIFYNLLGEPCWVLADIQFDPDLSAAIGRIILEDHPGYVLL